MIGDSEVRLERAEAQRINNCRPMDFMTDELFDGRRLRVLTIVDNFTRESPAIEVGQRMTGRDVATVLTRVGSERALLKTIRVDNGPEFISNAPDQWAYWNKVKLDFSRPGKPTDDAFTESFNGRLRRERLNENRFLSLEDARSKIETWRRHYNDQRPHCSLVDLAPGEFAAISREGMTDGRPKSLATIGTEKG